MSSYLVRFLFFMQYFCMARMMLVDLDGKLWTGFNEIVSVEILCQLGFLSMQAMYARQGCSSLGKVMGALGWSPVRLEGRWAPV